LVLQACCASAIAQERGRAIVLAAAPQGQSEPKQEETQLTPEEKMNRRFPQPIRVGDLIGLPLLDYDDSTIGYIRQVVRTPAGKIQLIVPYGRWFGWVRLGGPFDWQRRPVAVALETVVILGRQLNLIDVPVADLDKSPDFTMGQNTPIGAEETIKIALGRR
jgi:hypothetical protein